MSSGGEDLSALLSPVEDEEDLEDLSTPVFTSSETVVSLTELDSIHRREAATRVQTMARARAARRRAAELRSRKNEDTDLKAKAAAAAEAKAKAEAEAQAQAQAQAAEARAKAEAEAEAEAEAAQLKDQAAVTVQRVTRGRFARRRTASLRTERQKARLAASTDDSKLNANQSSSTSSIPVASTSAAPPPPPPTTTTTPSDPPLNDRIDNDAVAKANAAAAAAAQLEAQAAARLQAIARARQSRKRVHKVRQSVVRIQQFVRGLSARSLLARSRPDEEMQEAATRVQRSYRTYRNRKVIDDRIFARKRRAALARKQAEAAQKAAEEAARNQARHAAAAAALVKSAESESALSKRDRAPQLRSLAKSGSLSLVHLPEDKPKSSPLSSSGRTRASSGVTASGLGPTSGAGGSGAAAGLAAGGAGTGAGAGAGAANGPAVPMIPGTDIPERVPRDMGGILPATQLLQVAQFLTPAEEAAACSVTPWWRDVLSLNPRWKLLFESLYWSGPQVEGALAFAGTGYRQIWSEAQVQVPNGYGPEGSPNRNLTCLCGEVFRKGSRPLPHLPATLALVYLAISHGAKPSGPHFLSITSLPTSVFTRSSPVLVELLINSDPYLPQATADRLLSTMCGRPTHNPHTVAISDLLIPYHSGATSLPSSFLLSFSARKAATLASTRGAGASGMPGVKTTLENLPPLVAVLAQATIHNASTAALVHLLLSRQPGEVKRHSLSLLLGVALRSTAAHTEHTTAIVTDLLRVHETNVDRATDKSMVLNLDALGVRAPHSATASHYGAATASSSRRIANTLGGSPVSRKGSPRASPASRRRRGGKSSSSSSTLSSSSSLSSPGKRSSPSTQSTSLAEPLRFACGPSGGLHSDASVDIVRAIIQFDAGSARQPGPDGRLPMHVAVGIKTHSKASVQIVRMLIGSFREGVSRTSGSLEKGRYPLHDCVVRSNHNEHTATITSVLLKEFPRAARAPDPEHSRRLPADLIKAVRTVTPGGREVLKLLGSPLRRTTRGRPKVVTSPGAGTTTAMSEKGSPPGKRPTTPRRTPTGRAKGLSSVRAASPAKSRTPPTRRGPGSSPLAASASASASASSATATATAGGEGQAVLEPVTLRADPASTPVGGVDNIEAIDAADYDAEVTAEARKLFSAAFETGRFTYMCEETAELMELVQLKAAEAEWKEDQPRRLKEAAEEVEARKRLREQKLEAIAVKNKISMEEAAALVERMHEVAMLDKQRKEAEEEKAKKEAEEAQAVMKANKKRVDVKRRTKQELSRLKAALLSGKSLPPELLAADGGSLSRPGSIA